MSRPLVTVVIPTYNRLTFLPTAVQSVREQTYEEWEIVVVDDGSTDGTPDYLRNISSDRIRVIVHERCGNPARLRNVAVAQARGEFVAFLDSDDVWCPQKIARQLEELGAAPGCRWSYTYYTWINERSEAITLPRLKDRRPARGWILPDLIATGAWVLTSVVLTERSLLHQVGGFDESFVYNEDYELWLRLARASPVSLVEEPLTLSRQHADNMWRKRQDLVAESWLSVYQRMLRDPEWASVHRLVRRQHARATVLLAQRDRWNREIVRSLRTLLRAGLSGLALPAWWVSLAKSALMPILPAAIHRWYRAVRAARSS